MKNIKVFLVDDSIAFQSAAKTFLETEPEIEVVGCCESGEECSKLIPELCPDVVIMDVRLPGIDGPEASRQLKQSNPKLKVIICTIFEEKEAEEYAKRAKADDCFVKGAPLSLLSEKVRSLVSQK